MAGRGRRAASRPLYAPAPADRDRACRCPDQAQQAVPRGARPGGAAPAARRDSPPGRRPAGRLSLCAQDRDDRQPAPGGGAEVRRLRASTWLLGLLALLPPAATAADYPARPIRLIVPFAAGGAADLIGRVTGRLLSAALAVPVVIDNRGGAGGNIGADLAAKSPPDGYSLLMGNAPTLAIN